MANYRNQNKNSFIRDDINGNMLEENVDSIYRVMAKHTVTDGNGVKHYLTLSLDVGHDSFMELIVSKLNPKVIRWTEWIPPTKEEKEKAKAEGKEAFGTTIPYKGALE